MRWMSGALMGFALVLVGCGGLKSKIVGTWKIDPTSLKSKMFDQLKSNKQMADSIQKGMESTRFEFKDDGTFSVGGGDSAPTQMGKWSLDGENIKVTTDTKSNGPLPTLKASSDGSRIHLDQGTGDMETQMDLVKAK